MLSVRERIEQDERFNDSAILSHGFAPFLRDYDVVIEGRYRYRFTHCVVALAETAVKPQFWAWDDLFTDLKAWERAGAPEGFVWGVCWAEAYPGMSYVESSERARRWSDDLGHAMHEVLIETNVLSLRLVFHDLRVEQLDG